MFTAPSNGHGTHAASRPDEVGGDTGGFSHVGLQRTANEDTYLIATFQRSIRIVDGTAQPKHPGWSTNETFGTLLMVADGMGGHGGGDIASQSAVDAIANYLMHVVPWASSMLESLPTDARTSIHGLRSKLSSAVLAADDAIRAQSETSGAPRMGTTLTLAFVARPALYVAHVGDSRCYLLRDGKLLQLTNDHTLASQVERMGGPALSESAQLHHILWNCLGGGSDSRPVPDLVKVQLQPSDAVFLCTDGLTNELREEQIAAELQRPGPSKDVCERLVRLANEHGGRDNSTAVLLRP